jgi:DNA-directed RNA polymerase specialized sigma24 family protein
MNEAQAEPPDEELIRKIRDKEADPGAAEEAFTAFYERHVQFLYRCVASAERRLVGFGLGAEDIVIETFEKVWRRAAHSFSQPAGLSPEGASLRARQWLASIACNLVKDRLRSRKHLLPIDPGENEELFAEGTDCAFAAGHLQLIELVASALSPRDAAIVWFKVEHYDPETRQSQPPTEDLETFCQQWALSPAALRKAYERALATLRLALFPSTISHSQE